MFLGGHSLTVHTYTLHPHVMNMPNTQPYVHTLCAHMYTRAVSTKFLERFYQLMDKENSGRLTVPELLDAFSKLTWYCMAGNFWGRKLFEFWGFVAIYESFLCKIWGLGVFWLHQWEKFSMWKSPIRESFHQWRFPAIQYVVSIVQTVTWISAMFIITLHTQTQHGPRC